MFSITLYYLFLIGQSTALIELPSETYTFIQAQEHGIINEAIQSISDINQNIAAVDVRVGFQSETDEVKQSENDLRQNIDENQDIKRILNEIEAEEINNTTLTEDAEHVLHGFLSDLQYYKDKHNQSSVNEIGDHVVIADDEETDQLIRNLNNKTESVTEDDEEDDVGNTTEQNDQNDDINEYDPSPTQAPASGRRVYKGHHTRISQFPFIASVHVMGQFYCAGSIIGSSLIITAASCLQLAWNNRFFRENPKFLYVRVGSTFYNGGGELIQVLEVYFHPGYEPRSLRNNLAILRLRRNIRMSKRNKKRVKKIRYDTHASHLPSNTDNLVILGWGAREVGHKITNPMNNRLSYASLDFYNLQECQDIYSKEFVTNRHFCGGFISKGGGACNRDVGAPGLVGGILIGVVSFGAPVCGALDAPTVFTKLGYYKDWIERLINQPFHTHSMTTEKFKPYLERELIATPTTRMISRLPYIAPKVLEALKGISFLPPTSTQDYNVDSEVKNMLLMSMGRPAIQDQPYYQAKHSSEVEHHNADPMSELFGFDPIKGLRLGKNQTTITTTIITTANTDTLFEKNNEYFIKNNQPNPIGQERDVGNSLEFNKKYLEDKSTTTSNNKLMEKYLHEKKELEKRQKALQRERDEQIERNNQQFIEENHVSDIPKQKYGEPNILSGREQITPYINFANPEKVPVVTKTDTKLHFIEFDSEPVKITQLPSKYVSGNIEEPRLLIDYEAETAKKQKRPTGYKLDNTKKLPLSFDDEPERVKTSQFPSDFVSKTAIKQKRPLDYELENTKKLQYPSDDEEERFKKPQLLSDVETENVIVKNNTSYQQSGVKKKQIVSDFDPDHDAFEMLDKVVNDVKPNRDKDEEPQNNDEDKGLILEQSYLPIEDIPNSAPIEDDVQYVNIESVPMAQEANDQNIKSPDDDSIIQETFVNWDNVKEISGEKELKPNDDESGKRLKKGKKLSGASFIHVPEQTTSRQHFRERSYRLNKENRSHQIYPLPNSDRDSELSKPHYGQNSSDQQQDRQENTNEESYDLNTNTEIVDRANLKDNIYENTDYEIKEDTLENIPLSLSDVSAQEDSLSNSFSEEDGLEIDIPQLRSGNNGKIKNLFLNFNNTRSLKDEFYHIFADVVSEIDVRSNATTAKTF